MRNIFDEIKEIIKNNNVVLFMKGNSDSPMCGFSGIVIQILNNLKIKFHTVDILQDEEMRQGIKNFSNWPTIPQLYIKEEFIGGADIVKEMYQSNELQEKLVAKGIMSLE